MRGGGTGAGDVLSMSDVPAFARGVSVDSGLSGSLGIVGEGADAVVNDEALDGIDLCDGPLPLFQAAALDRASKLVGRGRSVPSSLAMTHPRLRLLD